MVVKPECLGGRNEFRCLAVGSDSFYERLTLLRSSKLLTFRSRDEPVTFWGNADKREQDGTVSKNTQRFR
jgi:hypothetical protein